MPGKKLLVADDSLTIQKVIRLALSNEGYEIQAVSDGNDAIQQISLGRPDVVLIDVSLPGKTAFEVKSEINALGDLEEVRFVLMSSAFEKVDEAQAIEVQFHGRLTKPFDPAHLRQVLTEVLSQVAERRMEKTTILPPFPVETDRTSPTMSSLPDLPTFDDYESGSEPTFSSLQNSEQNTGPNLSSNLGQGLKQNTSFRDPSLRNISLPKGAPSLPSDRLPIERTHSFQLDPPTFPEQDLWAPDHDQTGPGISIPAPKSGLQPPPTPESTFSGITPPPPMEYTSPSLQNLPPLPPGLPSEDFLSDGQDLDLLHPETFPMEEGDQDIRRLTESTMKISESEEFEWSVKEPVREPVLKPPPRMMDRGASKFEVEAPSFFDSNDGNDDNSNSHFMPPPTPPMSTDEFDMPPELPMGLPPIPPFEVQISQPNTQPNTKSHSSTAISQDQIEAMIKKQVEEALLKMVQKSLPDIAERLIKQEIHRLLSEN